MKWIKKLLLVAPLMLLLISGTAYAKNNVSEIDISVTVRDDGSAYVVQNWQGTFEEGTENYIPIATKDIGISDLKVSDEKGEYTFVDDWDIDADFDAKKRKCGINKTDDGVELCFGITDYGENKYAIEYVVTDFIKSYSDYDGTNFMFINPQMSTFPTDGKVSIRLENGTALDENNAGIWAFGYEGEVQFQQGSIVAYTTSALEDDNDMIVMFRLDKGILSPTKSVSKSFEEVKDTAFEGSDYGDDEGGLLETIIGFVVLIGIVVVVVWLISSVVKRKKAIKAFYEQANYYREVPNGGEIRVSHFLAQTFDVANEESLLIGALILSMINKGCIDPQTEESVGAFGKSKKSVNLKLIKKPDTDIEKKLYKVLVKAAGEDGILQEKELEKYAYKHPESVSNLLENALDDGREIFAENKGFTGHSGRKISDLTAKGKEELAEVMGLKKYLEDFSLISEREISETIIWQDYMVYATLFGIADKVIKQFEKVYPDRVPEFENYNRNVIIAHSYCHSMHRSAERAMQEERTNGQGGFASIGGGGGFSGGGTGGGSR